MAVTTRLATPADAARAGTICYEAFSAISGAHRFPADFPDADVAVGLIEHLIGRPDVHAVVAELDGRIVGSNFLLKAGPVAGVGPITVDPSVQNASVGRRLMQAVLDHAEDQGLAGVRLLQAAYHLRSLSLYSKLGFVAREPVATMQGAPIGAAVDGCRVRAAGEADLAPAAALCRRVHGHARTVEFREAVLSGAGAVVERDGRLTGYTTGIGYFGHAVGETTPDVIALVASATGFAGPGLLVPIRNAALFRWCLEHGLRVTQTMTLMSLGLYNEPQGAFLPSVLF
ncbi:MAG: GNAT family N-acetyltransferase [Marinovum algicola]|uniref:GNAT family N-acetyltransferase n=1 Tax=Alphaproteobacteria TaxID=28211 RepID=UPI0032EF1F7A